MSSPNQGILLIWTILNILYNYVTVGKHTNLEEFDNGHGRCNGEQNFSIACSTTIRFDFSNPCTILENISNFLREGSIFQCNYPILTRLVLYFSYYIRARLFMKNEPEHWKLDCQSRQNTETRCGHACSPKCSPKLCLPK